MSPEGPIRRSRSRVLGIAAIAVVTVVGLAWVLSRIDPDSALAALRATPPVALIPVLLLLTAVVVLRTWRYQLLLRERVGSSTMLSVIGVSFLAINVVPLRMGEFVRPWLLAQYVDVPFGSAVAAVVLERLLDLLALLVLTLLAVVLVDLPPAGVVIGGVDLVAVGQRSLVVLLVAGSLGVLTIVVLGMRAVEAFARPLGRLFPAAGAGVRRLGRGFVAGLRHLAGAPGRGLASVACTGAIWLVNGLVLAVMMDAFAGLAAAWDLVLLNLFGSTVAATLLPTPGFFGAYELGSAGTLELLGVDPTLAGTFALLVHLVIFLHTVVVGLLCLAVQGWSVARIVRAGSR